MLIEEQTGRKLDARNLKSPSYSGFLREGDRLYRQHLDPTECANLLDEALNEYARALEQVPDSAEVVSRMAKVFLRQGQAAKAERYAQKTLKLAQSDKGRQHIFARQEAYYVLGTIHYQAGRYEKAAQAYIKAIQIAPTASCRIRIGFFQASQSLAMEKGFSLGALSYIIQACYSLTTAVLLFPFEKERMASGYLLDLLPQMLLAWLNEEMGALDSALTRYLNINRRYPGLASVGIIIGDIYRERGQGEKSAYWFQRVLEKHPNHLNALYHLARLHEQREEYGNMAETYSQLAKLRPTDPQVFCNLANAYYYGQEFNEALPHYETALHLGRKPHWKAMVAQSIANIHADFTQHTEAAIAYYNLAKSLAPRDIENYIQLGMLYFQKEDCVNAELIYRQGLQIAPNTPRLHSNLGYLRWMDGDIESATSHYEKAIALDSCYEIPLNNLGVIHLDTLGEVHRAIELFQSAIRINEHYALAYYNLGRAYSFLDNRLEAAHCFGMAQELNQFSRELDNDELTARINNLFTACDVDTRD